jgi:hypothetical protein
MERQDLIQRLVARKLQPAGNAKAFCVAPSHGGASRTALCGSGASRTALCGSGASR